MPTLKLLAALFAAALLAACTTECVDKYDCIARIASDKNFAKKFPPTPDPAGGPDKPAQVTCVDSLCKIGDSGGVEPDAGAADGG